LTVGYASCTAAEPVSSSDFRWDMIFGHPHQAPRRVALEDLTGVEDLTVAPQGSVDCFDGSAEDVAGAALGDDVFRLRRVDLDLAAQTQHLDVYGTIVDLVVVHAA
jgi:predicted alpha/beta-hydrolase family hydrolase